MVDFSPAATTKGRGGSQPAEYLVLFQVLELADVISSHGLLNPCLFAPQR